MKVTRKKSLEAALAISTGFALIYYFSEIKVFLLVALSVGLIGLLSDVLSAKIAWLWFKLAELLGRVNGFILLSLLFYFLLTPLAWLRKLFKKDILQKRKPSSATKSYYIERNHEYNSEDLKYPW